jgi:hypothetical protein
MSLPHGVPPLRYWLVGLALSLTVAWVAGALLLDTVQPLVFDPQVGRYVATPGTTSRTRSEGWASSSVGEHGIRGLPGGKLPAGPKVVFWGDSFVEGVQVDDADRMEQVFTRLARDERMAISGIGVGRGGDNFVDTIFNAVKFVPALDQVVLHVFVMPRITDVLPGITRPGHASLHVAPRPYFESAENPPSSLSLRFASAFRYCELAAVFAVYRKAQDLEVRLGPGPVVTLPPSDENVAEATIGAEPTWDFLLGEMNRVAHGRLLLLYVPTLPVIRNGRVVRVDPFNAVATPFSRYCAQTGVPFLNLGSALLAGYDTTGRVPFGFYNSPPGTGHPNEEGHRMIAAAVLSYVKEHRDALLAP